MAVTVIDIAKAAGVGETTVRRALGDKEDISPETKARIKKIAVEMKYRPNRIAQFLVTGRSNQIGVVAAPSAFYTTLTAIEFIERELRNSGYSTVLSNSGGYPGGERASLEQLVADRVAGIIAIPASHGAELAAYQEVAETGTKLVIADRLIEGLQAPQVVGDDYGSAKLAVEHLVSLGHKRIGYLAIPLTCSAGRERARAYQDVMTAAGLPFDPSLIVETEFGEDYGTTAMRDLLMRPNRPTAVVARHDIVAMGAMRAIFSEGLQIPKDISIVGTGGLPFNDILKTSLTTVQHPMPEIARRAVAKLTAMLEGENVPAEIETLNVELIVRDSTAPPRG